ncbi:hypothetical protein [Formosa sp. S-31]|uniref:hypothetical protein n=1 Tax=Formosa sp. S-31 TaxID=2790949 RepID=UPI003EBA89A6
MKTFKITLFAALLFASLTSCVKEDLEDDDVLLGQDGIEASYDTGGVVDER